MSSNLDKNLVLFIGELSKPKLSQLSYEEIKTSIKKVLLLIGIKEASVRAMTEVEKQVLVSFIQTKFGNFTAQQFENAFVMALAGELELKPEQVEHYDKFNSMYVGKIMSAYRSWFSKYYDDNSRFIESYKPALLEPPRLSDDDIIENAYQLFKEMQNKMLALHSLSSRVLEILIERKELSSDETIIQTYKAKAKNIITAKAATDSYYKQRMKDDNYISGYANKLMIGDYFFKRLNSENEKKMDNI